MVSELLVDQTFSAVTTYKTEDELHQAKITPQYEIQENGHLMFHGPDEWHVQQG